jgi:hypothetical protein
MVVTWMADQQKFQMKLADWDLLSGQSFQIELVDP